MCNTIAALSRVAANFLRKARPQYHCALVTAAAAHLTVVAAFYSAKPR